MKNWMHLLVKVSIVIFIKIQHVRRSFNFLVSQFIQNLVTLPCTKWCTKIFDDRIQVKKWWKALGFRSIEEISFQSRFKKSMQFKYTKNVPILCLGVFFFYHEQRKIDWCEANALNFRSFSNKKWAIDLNPE